MQNLLRINPIPVTEWLYILMLAIPMILVMELFKFISRKNQEKKQPT